MKRSVSIGRVGLVAVLMVLAAVPVRADSPVASKEVGDDGIYSIVLGTAKLRDGGTVVKRNDLPGEEALRLQRLSRAFGKARITSVSNDNSRYVLELEDAGPLDGESGRLGLFIAGACLPVGAHSDPHIDKTIDLTCSIVGEKTADAIAERLHVVPLKRKDPQHRLETRWTPEKESYRVGEPVTLKLELRNTGKTTIRFVDGGKQSGHRNNQFRFLAYRSGGHGKAIPDTGNPENDGGPGSYRTLEPGETFTKSIGLGKWFDLKEPDTYRITGIYELELHNESFPPHGIWDDLAVGDCLVRITPKAEPAP